MVPALITDFLAYFPMLQAAVLEPVDFGGSLPGTSYEDEMKAALAFFSEDAQSPVPLVAADGYRDFGGDPKPVSVQGDLDVEGDLTDGAISLVPDLQNLAAMLVVASTLVPVPGMPIAPAGWPDVSAIPLTDRPVSHIAGTINGEFDPSRLVGWLVAMPATHVFRAFAPVTDSTKAGWADSGFTMAFAVNLRAQDANAVEPKLARPAVQSPLSLVSPDAPDLPSVESKPALGVDVAASQTFDQSAVAPSRLNPELATETTRPTGGIVPEPSILTVEDSKELASEVRVASAQPTEKQVDHPVPIPKAGIVRQEANGINQQSEPIATDADDLPAPSIPDGDLLAPRPLVGTEKQIPFTNGTIARSTPAPREIDSSPLEAIVPKQLGESHPVAPQMASSKGGLSVVETHQQSVTPASVQEKPLAIQSTVSPGRLVQERHPLPSSPQGTKQNPNGQEWSDQKQSDLLRAGRGNTLGSPDIFVDKGLETMPDSIRHEKALSELPVELNGRADSGASENQNLKRPNNPLPDLTTSGIAPTFERSASTFAVQPSSIPASGAAPEKHVDVAPIPTPGAAERVQVLRQEAAQRNPVSSLMLELEGATPVRVRLSAPAGAVRLEVHSPEAGIRQLLRSDLGSLVSRIEGPSYQALKASDLPNLPAVNDTSRIRAEVMAPQSDIYTPFAASTSAVSSTARQDSSTSRDSTKGNTKDRKESSRPQGTRRL